jgi:hypothetical protein
MVVRLSALAPAALCLPGTFLVLISVRGRVYNRAVMRLEGLGALINSMTSTEIESTAFHLVALVPELTTLPKAPTPT